MVTSQGLPGTPLLRGEIPFVRPISRADAQEMGRPIHCNSGKVTMTEKKEHWT
jgi:hypothetical protein